MLKILAGPLANAGLDILGVIIGGKAGPIVTTVGDALLKELGVTTPLQAASNIDTDPKARTGSDQGNLASHLRPAFRHVDRRGFMPNLNETNVDIEQSVKERRNMVSRVTQNRMNALCGQPLGTKVGATHQMAPYAKLNG